MIYLSDAPGLVLPGLPVVDDAGQNGVLLCTDRDIAICVDPDGKIYRIPLDKIRPDFYEPVAVYVVACWATRLSIEHNIYTEEGSLDVLADRYQIQEAAESVHAAFWAMMAPL